MPLSQTRSERQRFQNIRLFDIWKVSQQLFDSATGRHRSNDHADGHAHAPDAWFAAHDFRVHRDAVELLHVVMIAQYDIVRPGCRSIGSPHEFVAMPIAGDLGVLSSLSARATSSRAISTWTTSPRKRKQAQASRHHRQKDRGRAVPGREAFAKSPVWAGRGEGICRAPVGAARRPLPWLR